ncbi:MAG TPA: sigma-70 family RNA polymerase sigma factor [Tepidisphaeraceae bacterium]|nr:sigma-70 family RNA polymerase sigma factor [Tepidisphaeraceae bacterium]
MADEPPETVSLLARAAAGDGAAWGALLTAHQERLARMVAFRIDPRLRGRVDAADVVQDAFAEASAHRADYFGVVPAAPLFLWLRGVVSNKLLEVTRHHLGTHMRDAKRDRPLDGHSRPDDTSAALCANLTAGLTRPSIAAVRGEVRSRLAEALDEMDPTDREVLAMRHFEQLTSAEAAELLGIEERAAAKRYLRALKRLKAILAEMPGGLTELRP